MPSNQNNIYLIFPRFVAAIHQECEGLGSKKHGSSSQDGLDLLPPCSSSALSAKAARCKFETCSRIGMFDSSQVSDSNHILQQPNLGLDICHCGEAPPEDLGAWIVHQATPIVKQRESKWDRVKNNILIHIVLFA